MHVDPDGAATQCVCVCVYMCVRKRDVYESECVVWGGGVWQTLPPCSPCLRLLFPWWWRDTSRDGARCRVWLLVSTVSCCLFINPIFSSYNLQLHFILKIFSLLSILTTGILLGKAFKTNQSHLCVLAENQKTLATLKTWLTLDL